MVRIFRIQALDETVFLTRLMFPFLGFIALAAFFQGILNSFGIFRPAGFAPIVLNLAIIGGVYLLGPFMANPARAMALGVLIGGFLSGGVQFPFLLKLLKKKGWAFFFVNLKRAFTNPGVKTVVGLIIPTIVGMAAYQLNDLVSTALAGQAGEGVVSSLQYSLRLQELILGVFAVSIGTVLLPDLAGSAKSGQWEVYSRQLGEALNRIALITIPITFFSLVQGETLIRLLFQNRGFGEASVKLTLGAFSFHILGLFFIALNRILAPAFYAQNDSRSPALGGIISFGVNIALAALLAGPLGGPGIALALSLAGLVNTGLLLFFLGRNPRIQVKQVFRKTWRYTGKVTVISAGAILPILGLTPKLLKLWAGPGKLIPYGLPLGVNALVYSLLGILILAWTKDPYIQAFFSFFQSRFSKKKGIKKNGIKKS
jgi:putative peptidoglycan lipid II flippase